MRILSLITSHDAAVCILDEGRILLNLELERYSRTRNDHGYRVDFVRHALDSVGMDIGDIDLVCINCAHPGRIVASDRVFRPFNIPSTTDFASVPSFAAEILGRTVPAIAVNHQLAHLACAFLTSPFERAAILAVDGQGDQANFAVAVGVGNKLHRVAIRWLESAIGLYWETLCSRAYAMKRTENHFLPSPGPAKIMALAAYGTSDDELRQAVAAAIDSPIDRWPDIPTHEDLRDTHTQRSQAVAHALQERTVTLLTQWFGELARASGQEDLCYAGGLALNFVANARALRASPFRRLHIPPNPNDAGQALGMALFAWHHLFNNPRAPGFFSPYTGPVHPEESVAKAFEEARRSGAAGDDAPTSPEALGRLLADGHVLAIWRNRSECGPRALGHRSIVARPDRPDLREWLTAAKKKEWYRPFGSIVLAERFGELLEDPVAPSPYGAAAAMVRAEWRERLCGVSHIDGTTRPQALARDMEPFLYDMIAACAEQTGVPAVLSTNFDRDEPAVETPMDAVRMWLRSPIPYLLLQDRLLVRPLSKRMKTTM